jgi:2-polyprenyl-3-methyl-5-hydroxy-6-metoxy-1,4-benzoquinol methylase
MLREPLIEKTISGLHSSLIQRLPEINHAAPILDIGCGTGAWLARLSTAGFRHLHGIDLDVSQFKADGATCSKVNLDQDEMDFGEKKYELISAIELLEHLENPGRLFKFVSNYLDEKGHFLLTTPNIHSLRCRVKFMLTGRLASFDEKGDPTHIYPVLLTSLERILPRYSLTIVKSWSFPDKGTLIFRRPIRMMSAGLGLALPDPVPGDTLCLLIKRQAKDRALHAR